MSPAQQLFIRGDERCIVNNGSGSDEPVSRIAVQAVEFAGKDRNFSGQRQFDDALLSGAALAIP
jgi:hypothetical protein